MSDSASETWDSGMSGFWANDWLGKAEGQTLQMFKHDLLQVVNVTVTRLVDVRIHQCPSPHLLFFKGEHSASLSNHFTSISGCHALGLVG